MNGGDCFRGGQRDHRAMNRRLCPKSHKKDWSSLPGSQLVTVTGIMTFPAPSSRFQLHFSYDQLSCVWAKLSYRTGSRADTAIRRAWRSFAHLRKPTALLHKRELAL